jgi:hypothetical protein
VNGSANLGLGRAAGQSVLGSNNIAAGNAAGQRTTGSNNTAVGTFAGGTVSGSSNSAIGFSAGRDVTGQQNIALGWNAGKSVGASNTISVGSAAKATAANAIAIGLNALAQHTGSVTIGQGSLDGGDNTVSVGRVGAERRIVNVRAAVNPTDAVNLAQVKQLVKAAAAPAQLTAAATDKKNGAASAGKERGKRLASLSDAENERVGRSRNMEHGGAAPAASVSCELGGAKLTTTADEQSTSSSSFALVQRSGVSFQQAAAGCVTVSFSAEAMAAGGAIMEVKAVLDGNSEASPGPVYFVQESDRLQARAFNFFFPNAAPGAHRVELQFRNVGQVGSVKLATRTTMVHFTR